MSVYLLTVVSVLLNNPDVTVNVENVVFEKKETCIEVKERVDKSFKKQYDKFKAICVKKDLK